MADEEKMTNEEWWTYIAGLFPSEINGIVRPDTPILADREYSVNLPEWIRMDPLRYDLISAVIRQLMSNDERCREWINELMEALAKQDFNLSTQKIKGLMSAADKTKLDGVQAGAEVNQNAISNIKAGAQTIAATVKTDTLEIVAGTNIAVSVSGKKLTVGVDGIASGAEINQNAFATVQVGTAKINATAKTDTLTIAAGKNVSILTDTASKKIIIQLDGDLGLNLIQRNTAYEIGDIAYSPNLPSWAHLECVTAGTTASTDIVLPQNTNGGGALVVDGTVLWIIDDMRELCTVGDVVGKTYLPQGYVKANGATVQRADYPRLVNLANRYNLWTTTPATYPALFGKGDGSTTMVLPDWRGLFVRFIDDGKGYDAGRVLGSYQKGSVISIDTSKTAATLTGLYYDTSDNKLAALASAGMDSFTTGIYAKSGIEAISLYYENMPITNLGEAFMGMARPQNTAVLAVMRY